VTKALGTRPFWPLMNDLTGELLTDVGRKMRRGEYAYQAAANKFRHLERPAVAYHKCFPGPDLSEYHGDVEVVRQVSLHHTPQPAEGGADLSAASS
jgi:hypothetical protein